MEPGRTSRKNQREKIWLLYANNEEADQPAHQHSLSAPLKVWY